MLIRLPCIPSLLRPVGNNARCDHQRGHPSCLGIDGKTQTFKTAPLKVYTPMLCQVFALGFAEFATKLVEERVRAGIPFVQHELCSEFRVFHDQIVSESSQVQPDYAPGLVSHL